MKSATVAEEREAVYPEFDPETAVEGICSCLREQAGRVLRRRGLVVAMSGGVDSSVCAALAREAFGPNRVLGIAMPERDSDPESAGLAERLATELGIGFEVEPVGDTLESTGCYRRRDEAIREVVPEFGEGWRCKIVLPEEASGETRFSFFELVVEGPDGERQRHRLPAAQYRQIIAATNFKQRVRKMMEYYHADRLHYAVVGTPNRLEFDQGFFVKGGDGLADVKPIAHLYKREVYDLAEHLGLPDEITSREPTTDTFSLEQEQGEFYFGVPTMTADRLLAAKNRGLSEQGAADALGLPPDRIRAAFEQLERRRQATRYQHAPPLLVERIEELDEIDPAEGA